MHGNVVIEHGLLDLIISRIPALTSAQKIKLCTCFERESDITCLSCTDVLEICAPFADLRQKKLFSEEELAPWSMDKVRLEAEKDAIFMERCGIRCVSYKDSAYPPLLKEIFDPPAALFYKGTLPSAEKPLISIVGTRKPSGAALAKTYELARGLSGAGFIVVSGLATGIDAMAHRGAVEESAATAAVFGCSVDNVYPMSNRHLARRILESGGVFLSEYPCGTPPRKWTFPARNRIISGLCKFCLVAEAGEKSGALITADFALEQNRDLGVLVEKDGTAFGKGCRSLAAAGAQKIECTADIVKGFGLLMAPVPVETKGDLVSKLKNELGL
ncbi:DNA processing protein DprA [Spirochaetia bacterium]|nr:DNA processing protein DprA [Spirochaetia bacterium]